MDTKHTPGPWTAKDSPGAGLGIWADLRPALGAKFSQDFPIYGFDALPAPKVQIAYEQWVQFPSEEWSAMQEAKARLIAAAPELLTALQTARASVEGNLAAIYEAHYQPHIGDLDAEGRIAADAEEALLSRIDAAIAKATGAA